MSRSSAAMLSWAPRRSLAVGEEPEPAFDLVQGLQRVIAALHRDLDLARPSSRRGDWQPGRERPGALALSQAPLRLR